MKYIEPYHIRQQYRKNPKHDRVYGFFNRNRTLVFWIAYSVRPHQVPVMDNVLMQPKLVSLHLALGISFECSLLKKYICVATVAFVT